MISHWKRETMTTFIILMCLIYGNNGHPIAPENSNNQFNTAYSQTDVNADQGEGSSNEFNVDRSSTLHNKFILSELIRSSNNSTDYGAQYNRIDFSKFGIRWYPERKKRCIGSMKRAIGCGGNDGIGKMLNTATSPTATVRRTAATTKVETTMLNATTIERTTTPKSSTIEITPATIVIPTPTTSSTKTKTISSASTAPPPTMITTTVQTTKPQKTSKTTVQTQQITRPTTKTSTPTPTIPTSVTKLLAATKQNSNTTKEYSTFPVLTSTTANLQMPQSITTTSTTELMPTTSMLKTKIAAVATASRNVPMIEITPQTTALTLMSEKADAPSNITTRPELTTTKNDVTLSVSKSSPSSSETKKHVTTIPHLKSATIAATSIVNHTIASLFAAVTASYSATKINLTESADGISSTILPAVFSNTAFVSNTTGMYEQAPQCISDETSKVALVLTVGAVAVLVIACLFGCICATKFKAACGLIKSGAVASEIHTTQRSPQRYANRSRLSSMSIHISNSELVYPRGLDF